MPVQEVYIQNELGISLFSVEEEASIFDLMKKIKKETEDSAPFSLKYLGYEITDDKALVKDFLLVGCNTFTQICRTKEEAASLNEKEIKTTKNQTDETAYLITGNRHSFQWLDVPPKSTMSFKLKSNKFGVVYKIEGTEGMRVFHLETFKVKEPGMIKLEGQAGEKAKVLYVHAK